MRRSGFAAELLAIAVLAAGCGSIPDTITINVVERTQDVSQIVKATFQAMTAQAPGAEAAPSQVEAPASQAGSISGSLNYPADVMPSLYVVAYQVGTQNYRYVITNAGQTAFQIDDLQPATYHVVAYVGGGGAFPIGLSGGYSNAVLCGLAAGCDDHSLVDVEVSAGEVVPGVNPTDWYAPEGAFPAAPAELNLIAATPAPLPAGAEGSIEGSLMFPAGGIPALRIVAFEIGSNAYFYADAAPGQTSYKIDHVPAGTYHVVAYSLGGGGFAAGTAGGFTQMVPCGLQYGCTDHTLIDVTVSAGSTATGVNPNDYYADPGAFPPNPVP